MKARAGVGAVGSGDPPGATQRRPAGAGEWEAAELGTEVYSGPERRGRGRRRFERCGWDLPTGDRDGDSRSPSLPGRADGHPWAARSLAAVAARSPASHQPRSGQESEWIRGFLLKFVSISPSLIFASWCALSKPRREEWIAGRVGHFL